MEGIPPKEMDLNPINKPKRRRTVNKAEWTKEKRKRLRIAGKEYVNAKGEVVPEKQPGPDCKCRRRCYEKVSKAVRMKLFKGYYALQSHDEQNAYLFGLIRKVPIARKRAEGSTRRTCTFNYYIRVGGQETQVCVKALANIHGVGKSKIHILCEKLGQSVLFPRDERGRHSKMPKKVSDETVELVKNHIYDILHTDKNLERSICTFVEHSIRYEKIPDIIDKLMENQVFSIIHSDQARDFLKDEKANNGPDVNITAMHKNFLDIYDPEYQEELAMFENQAFEQFQMQNGDYRQQMNYNENNPISGDPVSNNSISNPSDESILQPAQKKKKRKTMKDGRPEPLIRQWYYSKIFHDIYTTKEAIALRKKIISWKCLDDFVVQKKVRKQRQQKKTSAEGQPGQPGQQNQQMQSTQHQRLSKSTSTNTNNTNQPIAIAASPSLPSNKVVHEVQIQNVPLKKPVQVFQTAQGQDMYSIYPMTILQDLAQIETTQAVNLTHAQPIQQTQLRTIAPTHFQATVTQPLSSSNGMTISTGNLQALGVNINLAQGGSHYTSNHGVMSYKFG